MQLTLCDAETNEVVRRLLQTLREIRKGPSDISDVYGVDLVNLFDFGAPTFSAGELLDDDAGIENVRLTYDDNTPLTDTAHATI